MSKKTFKDRIIAFMKRNNYTQAALADKIGVTHMTVSYWVNGKHEPDVKVINALREAGMTIEEILGK